MISNWLARGLDQAFIRLWLRPTLPRLEPTSRLTLLRLAEERSAIAPLEARLFPELSPPECSVRETESLSSGLTRLTRQLTAPDVPLEFEWFARTAAARCFDSRWYVRQTPRPLLIAVGGWQPFRSIAADALWPLRRLDRAGYDVVTLVMPELPPAATGSAAFPSNDPSRNIVELARFASCIQQVQLLARSLGHEKITIWGTSLGAHLVALLATTEQPLIADGYVLEKPLLRMSDPLRLHGRGLPSVRRDVALRLDRVYRAVSPIERTPRVSADRVQVIGALFDGVTPASGAEHVAKHFGAQCQLVAASHLHDPRRSKRMLEMLSRQCEPCDVRH